MPAMKTVHAIFANGVFQPKEQVDLPEASEVEFEPRTVRPGEAPSDLLAAGCEVLAKRYASGEPEDLPLSPVAIEIEQFVRPERSDPEEA